MARRAAVVTGSTSGIGWEIARALARTGFSVMLNGVVTADVGEQRCVEIAREFGVEAQFSGMDLADIEQCGKLIAQASESLGRIDVLVNNAGIQHVSPIESFPAERWDAILAINLSAAFHLMQHALPGMRARGWGRIVNIASAHGLVASPGKSAYVAAKHGLVGLTKVVALETAVSGITCNCICPGWVKTPLVDEQIATLAASGGIAVEQAQANLLRDKHPSERFTTVAQIGAMVVFLCSEAADNITGAAFTMDGGWTAQ